MNYESIKKRLAEIWKDMLDLKQIDDDDNYFLLGGNSIIAMKLISHIENEFSVTFTLENLFEISTFSAQVDYIREKLKDSSTSLKNYLVPEPSKWSEEFPLTDIQEAYWLGRQNMYSMGGIATKYYIEFEENDLNIKKANESWQKLIQHHSMMRTIFSSDGKHQKSLEHVPEYIFPILNLSDKSPSKEKEYIDNIRTKMMAQNFNAEQWPLFEVRITKLKNNVSRIHVCFDSIAFDAWSILFLLNQWEKLYRDPAYELPILEVSFRDYVLALKKIENTEIYARDERYWNMRLKDIYPAPELPLSRQPDTLSKQHFMHMERKLSKKYWEQLKKTAKKYGITVSAVLLTAYAEVLAKWSRHSRFTINLTRYNKLDIHPQMDEIIGDFTSLTLFTFDGANGKNFLDRCKNTLGRLWQDMAHPYMCGIRVLRELTKRNSDQFKHGIPIVFTSSLGLDVEQIEDKKWIGKRVYSISQTSQVWLDHQILEDKGELVLIWDALEEIFPAGMLEDMFNTYIKLVYSLADNETIWTESSKSLVEDPNSALKVRMNATEGDVSNETLLSLFEKQCIKTPDNEAVVSMNQRLTYKELFYAAESVCKRIRKVNKEPNGTIAIVMEKGWEQVVAVLGIYRAGSAYLPIDPATPKSRMELILKESNTKIVVTQAKFCNSGLWSRHIEQIVVDYSCTAEKPKGIPSISNAVNPQNLAYIIYTSGSTGRPKGVMIDHSAAVNTILDINRKFNVVARDRILSLSSLSFDLSVYDLFGILSAGACIVFPDPSKERETKHWIQLMKDENITIWNTVPAIMEILTNSLNGGKDGCIYKALRLVLLSGDWIPLRLPDEIRANFPHACIVGLGGATEASIWSNYCVIKDISNDWKSIPYGTPLTNQKLYILNELMEDTPDWVPGALYIAGKGLAIGYCNDDEKTSQKFIYHPRTQERIYATGDIARYLPDGNIEFLGREDSQVKINGYRIESGEIEAVARSFSGVKEALVEPYNSELNTKLVCFVVEDDSDAQDVKGQDNTRSLNVELSDLYTNSTKYKIPNKILEKIRAQDEWMNLISTLAIYKVFYQYGIFTEPGKNYTIEDVKNTIGIVDQYDCLVYQWFRILVADGVLKETNNRQYTCINVIDSLISKFNQRKGACHFQSKKLEKILDEVPVVDLITGKIEPLKLFLGDSNSLTPKALETFSDAGSYCSDVALDFLESLLKQSGKKTTRILEVGTRISPFYVRCQNMIDNTLKYRYSDESLFFIDRAKKENAENSMVEYCILDYNNSPLEQGYEAHSVDIIIADNTLHRFKDINKTLGYIKQLLAPDGVLLFLEATENSRTIINTMGLLTKGFNYLADERAQCGLPMLTADEWCGLLRKNGFISIWSYPEKTAERRLRYCLFVAEVEAVNNPFNQKRLLAYLEERLPAYMVPAKIAVIDKLPLSQNGKVDRKALRKFMKNQKTSEKVPPKNKVEENMLNVWKKLLKRGDIGITDNFFELGGDSLLAIQCIDNLNKQFGLNISMKQFYDALTVEKLAQDFDEITEGEI